MHTQKEKYLISKKKVSFSSLSINVLHASMLLLLLLRTIVAYYIFSFRFLVMFLCRIKMYSTFWLLFPAFILVFSSPFCSQSRCNCGAQITIVVYSFKYMCSFFLLLLPPHLPSQLYTGVISLL